MAEMVTIDKVRYLRRDAVRLGLLKAEAPAHAAEPAPAADAVEDAAAPLDGVQADGDTAAADAVAETAPEKKPAARGGRAKKESA